MLEQEERMRTILEQEKMIFGSAGELEGFNAMRSWFSPFYELATGVYEIVTKKKLWLECPLSEIDPEEVD